VRIDKTAPLTSKLMPVGSGIDFNTDAPNFQPIADFFYQRVILKLPQWFPQENLGVLITIISLDTMFTLSVARVYL
jgi:hypothetical protein